MLDLLLKMPDLDMPSRTNNNRKRSTNSSVEKKFKESCFRSSLLSEEILHLRHCIALIYCGWISRHFKERTSEGQLKSTISKLLFIPLAKMRVFRGGTRKSPRLICGTLWICKRVEIILPIKGLRFEFVEAILWKLTMYKEKDFLIICF